jgi:hypothetical protein
MCLSSAAFAAEPEHVRVAIVASDVSAPLVKRLSAELQNIGIDTIVIEAELVDVVNGLQRASAANNAVAAFSVSQVDAKVLLLVPDSSNNPVVRDLGITGDPTQASSVVGVRAAEVLRAGLLETRGLDSRRGLGLSISEIAHLDARTADPTSVAVGLGPMFSSVGKPPQLATDVRVAVPVAPSVSVLGGLAIPLTRMRYTAEPGDVRVGGTVVQGGIRYAVRGPAGLRPDISVGACAVRLQAEGDSDGEAIASTERIWRFAPWTSAGVSAPVARDVRLRLDAQLEAFSPVRIHLADAAVHQWGPLQTRAVLGVEVSL